jgi:hypothetical protein
MSRFEELGEEITEIARVLMRRTGKTEKEVWDEALTLHRVRYAREIRPPPEDEERHRVRPT